VSSSPRVTRAMFGMLAATTLGVVFLGVAYYFAGGGHGSYLPAKVLFPYGMMVAEAREAGSLRGLPLVLILAQYPVYGVVLGAAADSSRSRTALWAVLLSLAHLSALAFVLLRFSGGWPTLTLGCSDHAAFRVQAGRVAHPLALRQNS
jgi:hypothetical protein